MKHTASTLFASLPKTLALGLLALLILTIGSLAFSQSTASAASKRDWVTEDIISDAAFTNKNAMSVNQIQSFLDKQIGSCDVWGKGKAVEFGSNQTRAQYAKSRGWHSPPYVCLNKYYEVPKITPTKGNPVTNFNKNFSKPKGSKSAAWIIKDAANRSNISPKVLLVKIATESAGPLTGDRWPLFSQYRYAMGSNCPDSGPGGSANCDDSYAGFSIQMYSAAQLMRSYLDNMDQPWWSLKRPGKGVRGSNYVGWNVAPTGCGGTNLNIRNKATAALYTYTPYQPNAAALNNMYGTGNGCSAYGNRNFWRVYVDWFGSTKYVVSGSIKNYYNANNGSSVLGNPVQNSRKDKSGFYWQEFEKGYIAGQANTGYYAIKGSIGKQYGIDNGPAALGKPLEKETKDANSYWSQKFSKGYVIGQSSTGYYIVRGSISSRFDQLGGLKTLGAPVKPQAQTSDGMYYQQFNNGYIVGTYATGYWQSNGEIRDYWSKNGYQSGSLGLPLSPIRNVVGGEYQKYQQGTVVGNKSTGYFIVKGSIGQKYTSNLANNAALIGLPLATQRWHSGGVYTQQYQRGYIVGKSGNYHISRGLIRDYWLSIESWNGKMGLPTGPVIDGSRGMTYQHYETGVLILNPNSDNVWESKGSIRSVWATLGYQSGKMGYPAGSEKYANGVWSQEYENGTIQTKNGKRHRVIYK